MDMCPLMRKVSWKPHNTSYRDSLAVQPGWQDSKFPHYWCKVFNILKHIWIKNRDMATVCNFHFILKWNLSTTWSFKDGADLVMESAPLQCEQYKWQMVFRKQHGKFLAYLPVMLESERINQNTSLQSSLMFQ